MFLYVHGSIHVHSEHASKHYSVVTLVYTVRLSMGDHCRMLYLQCASF